MLNVGFGLLTAAIAGGPVTLGMSVKLVPKPGFGAAAAPATPRAKVAATAILPAAILSANFGGLTNFLRASCVAGGRTEMGAAIDPTAYYERSAALYHGRLGGPADNGNRHGG